MSSRERITRWSLLGCGLLALSIVSWSNFSSPRPSDRLEEARPQPGKREIPVLDDKSRETPPAIAAHSSAGNPGASWSERWLDLTRTPASAQRDQQRAALLKELARSDPQRAISLARLESDLEVRQSLFRALLEGWSARDLKKAGEWAMQQNDLHHDLAMSAVFNGAGADPEAARQFAERLAEQHPDRAKDYGSYLIFSLAQAGAYQQAAEFATAGNAGADQSWIIAAYGNWARHHPEVAVLAATDLGEPEQRGTAFRAAIYAWAQTDPKALVDYANGFPEGEERSFALVAALRAWRQKEPQAAKAWLAKSGPIPGMKVIDED